MLLIKTVKITVALLITGVVTYMLFIAKFDIVSRGEGVLSISDSNVNILSPSSGTIRKIYVTRGDTVSIGSPLLMIANIEDENKRELLEYNFKFYTEQVDKLKVELDLLRAAITTGSPDSSDAKIDSTKLLKIVNKYKAYTQKVKDLTSKQVYVDQKIGTLNRQEKILKDKSEMIKASLGNTVRYLDSWLEVERIKTQSIENQLLLEDAKDQVEAAYLDFTQLVLDVTEQTENEYRKNKELLAATRSELNTVNDRIQSTDLNSTITGTVLSLKVGFAEGVYIERNSEIMTLKRDDDGVYVDAKFDSKFRPYLGLAEVAKVKINAPGIKDYFYGKITGISVDSFDYDEYSKQGSRYYNVKVAFDKDAHSIHRLHTLLGIKTNVYVINKEMTFIEYIFSIFNKDLDFSVW